MSDPRKTLKQSINDALFKLQELEYTIEDFSGDQSLLAERINALVQALQKLQSQSSLLDYKLPTELLHYLDKGGNPDGYTAEVFARANRANQYSKGKVGALQSFKQAAALLQLLNAMAGGRDVGTAVTITCQTIIKGQGHISAQPPVKRLAYNIVKGAALSDSDWDNVLVGFQHDISPTYPSIEIQMVALEILPLIPAHKLASLMASEGDFSSIISRQMNTSQKEVSSVAVSSVGKWLSDAKATDILALSPNIQSTAKNWAGIIAQATLDPSQILAAAAFDAVRRILSSTEHRRDEPGGDLRDIVASEICTVLLRSLPEVLHKSRGLIPEGQVNMVQALQAFIQYCCTQPVFPSIHSLDTLPISSDLMVLAQPVQQKPEESASHQSAGVAIVEQIGYYIQTLLTSVFPPLAFEAARCLLAICSIREQPGSSTANLGVAAAWAPLAIETLIQLWKRDSGPAAVASHTQLLDVAGAHIKSLPALGQLELAVELLPLIAKVPSAAARCRAQAQLWGAIVDQDLTTRQSRRCGDLGPPANELKTALTTPFVLAVVTAKETGSGEADYPAYREELVSALMETLLGHPYGATQGLDTPEEEASNLGSLVAATKIAARVQAAGDLVDWLGTAKIALQGTKACLGWDRDPENGTYACTAVTDSWLVLLQRSLHATRALQAASRARSQAPALQTQSTAPFEQQAKADPQAQAQADGGLAEIARVAASYVGALQELLDQLLTHWQALSSAVQPRALWLAAHHYELAPSLDPGWAHLLQSLSTSLGVHDDDAKTRRKQSLRSAAAAGQMQALMDDGSGGFISPIDEAEIRTEAMAVGLVAADRLASLLLYNAEVGPRPGLKEISAGLLAVLQPLAAPSSSAGPQSREQAARIVAYLTPLAVAPAPSAEAGEALAIQTAFGAKLLPNPDWPLNEGFPMAGPSGAILQSTRRGARYWALKGHIQNAVSAAYRKEVSPSEAAATDPDAFGILQVMAFIENTDNMGPGTVLTSPNDPLRLTVWHTLDKLSSRATLQFEAHNQVGISLEGVTIRLGLGGPIVAEAKQPPAYRLAVLPAGESVTWRFTVRITSFGRACVQAFVLLPNQAPLEQGDDAALRCDLYESPLTVLLSKPSSTPQPASFFQAWPSLAHGTEITGVCRNRGAVGGLQALTALEAHFTRVSLQALPAQGGFHAAYAGEVLNGIKIGLVVTGQLLPVGLPPPRVYSAGFVATGHVVCRISIRSAEAAVIAPIRNDPARWIQELCGRTMVEGINAEGLLGPAAPFKIDQSLIPLERLYVAGTEDMDTVAKSDAVANAQQVIPRMKEEVVETAVAREWHRVRLQRLGLAV